MLSRVLQPLLACFALKILCLAGLVGAFYLVRFVLRLWRELGRQ